MQLLELKCACARMNRRELGHLNVARWLRTRRTVTSVFDWLPVLWGSLDQARPTSKCHAPKIRLVSKQCAHAQ